MKSQATSMLHGSVMGFANVLAIVAAFLLTPVLDRHTVDFVVSTAIETYGSDIAWFARYGWMLSVGAMVFFLARAGIAIAIMLISSWAILRFGAVL